MCASLPTLAQDDTIQTQIGAAHELLRELDTLADACLNPADPTTSTAACDRFLNGLDGELVATYLQTCASLRAWREEFVTTHFNTDTPDAASADRAQDLVGVEFVCGEEALLRRTRFVAEAFAQTRNARATVDSVDPALHRLNELQFERRLETERDSLFDSVQEQRLHRERETARQMQQLENELIRQQITPLDHRR